MKRSLIAALQCIFWLGVARGEVSLAHDAGSNLPRPRFVAIAADGKFVAYNVAVPQGTSTAIWQSSDGKVKREWSDARAVGILPKSGVTVIEGPGDQLILATMRGADVVIPHARAARVISGAEREWLVYQKGCPDEALVVRDRNGVERQFAHVTSYSFSSDAQSLVIHTQDDLGAGPRKSMHWVDLASERRVYLWSADYSAGGKSWEPKEVWNDRGDALAYATDDNNSGTLSTRIWCFRRGMAAPDCVVRANPAVLDTGLEITAASAVGLRFMPGGDALLFHSHFRAISRPKVTAIGLDVWSYKDPMVQSEQLALLKEGNKPSLLVGQKRDSEVSAIVHLSDRRINALRRLGKKAWMLQYDGERHVIGGPAGKDFDLRVMQFLDHYLKGALPPKWMTEGIPAKDKGYITGLELDTSGREP